MKKSNVLVIGASGYIGSRLSFDLSKFGYRVIGCDLRYPIEGIEFIDFFHQSYQDISDEQLNNIDVILWFAGHSTVAMSSADPIGSFRNNVTDLVEFFRKSNLFSIPIIYASSASIYSSSSNDHRLVADERRTNPYDSSKLSFDITINSLKYRALGLRMGTIAGWSPVMRWDTLFNATNYSAYHNGVVNITNPSNFRGILFLDDLVQYILGTIDDFLCGDGCPAASQVPLASWSGSIGSLGVEVAAYWKVPVTYGGDNGTYSFVVRDQYLRKFVKLHDIYKSISDRCSDLSKKIKWELK